MKYAENLPIEVRFYRRTVEDAGPYIDSQLPDKLQFTYLTK